jgi:RHS repeat-associated protein
VVDEQGNVKEYYDYYPFGKTLRSSITDEAVATYKYTGKELDDENDLNWYYFGALYYDAEIGRWLTPDPKANKYPSLSPYVYCGNNPIIFIDPDGEEYYVDEYGYIMQQATIFDPDDPSVYRDLGDKGLMYLGEVGGDIYINEIFNNLLDKNINMAKDIWNPFTFKNLVKTGGEWDYKNNLNTIYGLGNYTKGTFFNYENMWMDAQDLGNFHFGIVGKGVGYFPEWFMLYQAGRAQIKDENSSPEWQKGRFKPPYGDDPRDQFWIQNAFWYYNLHKNKYLK